LRKILRDNKGTTPKQIANIMRSLTKTKDLHAKQAAQTLPPNITKEDILRMPADRQRLLTSRYGAAALNNRLRGIN
jgi:Tfp pilus assembly PilM family ATPase